MNKALKVVTPPTVEPVTRTEAKLQCRIDGTTDDTLVDGLILAAREYAESVLKRALVTQTLELVLDQFPCGDHIDLPRPPLASVTSIKYTDANGLESTFSASSYIVDADSQPGRVALKWGYTWPATVLQSVSGVRIRYVAGYGLAVAVPQKIKQAILLLIGHWYENREQVQVGSGLSITEIPLGVQALLGTERIITF